MSSKDHEEFWHQVNSGENPLLSVMHGLTEKWGLPAIIMCLGDIAVVLAEEAEDADNLTPSQRGLVLGACAQVSQLSDQMRHEIKFLGEEATNG